jgi:hypothetical protein
VLPVCNGGSGGAAFSDTTFDAGYNFAFHAVADCTWSAVGANPDAALVAVVAELNAHVSLE